MTKRRVTLSLEDQAILDEAVHSISDVTAAYTGLLDCDPLEAIEDARKAMGDARAVLTRYRRRVVRSRKH